MLTQLRRQFFAIRKDYYQILGIPRNASEEEIKQAYFQRAKQYHPDVRTDSQQNSNPEKFQEIAEAYAVLSVRQSKVSYDLLNTQQPESVFMSKRDAYVKQMNERGIDGQLKREEIKNEYQREKRQILEEERKRFNVDQFGRYNGGVPQKGKGFSRGNAWGTPGQVHDPELHNFKNNPTPDTQFVTAEDALAFKHYQQGNLLIQNKKTHLLERIFGSLLHQIMIILNLINKKQQLQVFEIRDGLETFQSLFLEFHQVLKFMPEGAIDKLYKD